MHPEISLSRFFELLDTLDPVDRDALIGHTSHALGVSVSDVNDEEAEQEARYRKFKNACDTTAAMDHFVLRGVVLDMLNIHQQWSDSSSADSAIKSLIGFVKFRLARGATEEEVQKWRILAEQKQVQKQSDLQVARRRYDTLCEQVVKPLIHPVIAAG